LNRERCKDEAIKLKRSSFSFSSGPLLRIVKCIDNSWIWQKAWTRRGSASILDASLRHNGKSP